MIPRIEQTILMESLAEARALAEAREIARGFTVLQAGLSWARELQAGGEPWAGELTAAFRQAVELYLAHYSILRD